ncbi:YeeE/YedE family protein [Alteromonas sp. BL110]|uniref:YeeE/YedE family protein n=1 Tax=Alteromonas sp. BL110 TaxID=1714845 RepID=UPI000E54CF49|nr:YeeE/YedE family protein [Alteromonas sp. BL110]AXT38458.1 YeeE/YedE family protein [Alteromonas sp. BL110]MBR9895276.1 YeeE/YedE family protein [Gammaproteobacteria bacterium]RKM83797.1 YeeE/YedE family protein [Alteromonas sp. BL110]
MESWTTTPFEPLAGLAGGLLIGSSVVLLLYTLGRIAGISGIAAGAMTQRGIERYWRLAFLLGVVLAAVLYMVFVGNLQVQTQMSSAWLVVAGLLVGFGTRLGSGCTSGHGVAGLSRLSPRSIVATLTFMSAAVLTTTIIRHL